MIAAGFCVVGLLDGYAAGAGKATGLSQPAHHLKLERASRRWRAALLAKLG